MRFSQIATGATMTAVAFAAPVAIDIPSVSLPTDILPTDALSAIPSVSLPTDAISIPSVSLPTGIALPSGLDLSSLTDLDSLSSLSGLEGLANITTSLTQLGELLTSGSVPNATVIAPIVEEFFSSVTSVLNSLDLSIFDTDTTQVDSAASALSTLLGTTQSYLDEFTDAATAGIDNDQLTAFATELESIFGIFTAALQDLLNTNLFRVGVSLVLNALPSFITQATSALSSLA